jgi:hypothetical protein
MEQLCPLLRAIDLIRPDGAMARDVLDNQNASREGYDRHCRDGYRDVVIPVWQARPAWDPSCDAADYGRLAAHDPALRAYVESGLLRPTTARAGWSHAPGR